MESEKLLKLLLEKQKSVEKELAFNSKRIEVFENSFNSINKLIQKTNNKSSVIYSENRNLKQLIKTMSVLIDRCDHGDYDDIRLTFQDISKILKEAEKNGTIE